MKKITPNEEEKEVIYRIIKNLFDLELSVRQETNFTQEEISQFISMALVNFIGNFMVINSRDMKSIIKNKENFIRNVNDWFLEYKKGLN